MNIINNIIDQSWNFTNPIYSDLIMHRDLIYNPCQFKCSKPIMEKESSEYGACNFELNSIKVKFRVAKITPTKIGQFVTLWKRIGNGPIKPYDLKDDFDLVIISARKEDKYGQFIFPKSILYKHGIISNNDQGGKRAIRVYPPWDVAVNQQAKKT